MALAVSAGLLSGCATSPAPVRDGGRSHREPSRKEKAEVSERRVEAQARYAAGLAYELRRDTDRALEEFIKSVEADPSNEDLTLEVSRRLLLKKDFPRALALGRLAAAQPGASAQAYSHLAVLHAESGQIKEAEQASRRAIELAPDLLSSYYHLYTLYLNQGQFAPARAVLEDASRRPVAVADYWLDLAELFAHLLRAQPEAKDAVLASLGRCLQQADELGVTSPLRRLKLADGYALAGETERAVRILLQALDDDPEDSRVRDLARQKLVALYISNQDADGALAQLELMVRDHPENPQAAFLLATVALDKKNFTLAEQYFRRTLELKPDFEQAYYSLTVALLELRQDEAAARWLTTTREKYPNSFIAQYYSAIVYSRLEEPAKAVEFYNAAEATARAAFPNRLDHEFYFQMGAQLERAKLFDDAARTFKRCLELKPDFHPALNYLGYMWADEGVNLEEARQLIQKAVDLEPKNPAYLDSLAWVLYKLDQPHLALTHMEEALKHQEEPDATLFDHLGDIHLAIGNRAEARRAWEQSLKVEDSPAVRQKLEAPADPPGSPAP